MECSLIMSSVCSSSPMIVLLCESCDIYHVTSYSDKLAKSLKVDSSMFVLSSADQVSSILIAVVVVFCCDGCGVTVGGVFVCFLMYLFLPADFPRLVATAVCRCGLSVGAGSSLPEEM